MTTPFPQAAVRRGGDEPSGQAHEHARALASRLTARGLRASGELHRGGPAGAMAVAAQRVDVHPYAGRLVVLLPDVRDPDELLWHWPRLYRGHEHTGVCWFQPFSTAAAYDDTADRIAAVIAADVRRRSEGGGPPQAPLTQPDAEVGLRQVLDSIGQPLHKLVYRQLEVLDELQKRVEVPALLRGLYGIDHLGMRALRGLERIAVLGGVRARELPEPLLLARVLREAASQVKDFPRVRIPPPSMDVDLPRDAAPEVSLLLAELIENATRFSPRDTDVLVTVAVAPESGVRSAGLRIEIADRGELPMPLDQLAALNRLLAAPGSVDLRKQIIAGQLGLLVVATVAERHGVRVVLHARSGGGMRAVVELPEALLLEPRLPLVSAAPVPTRVIAGAREPVVGQVPPSERGPAHAAPTEPVGPVEVADAHIPRRAVPPSEIRPSTSEAGPSVDPAAGDLPPLPRRPGAHRRVGAHWAVNGLGNTSSHTTSSHTTSSASSGADVGAAAAFLQGVHDPAADQAEGVRLPGPPPKPPPDSITT